MIINVTKEHIDNGVRAKCKVCPVALAVKAALGVDGLLPVYVDLHEVWIGSKIFQLPMSVTDWISIYDYQGIGEPFSFELNLEPA